MAISSVPVVDLASPNAPALLDAAFEEWGFVQLLGHGVPLADIAHLWNAFEAFFALDEAVKLGYVNTDPLANRGYRSRGSESLAYSIGKSAPPDLFESFNMGHDSRATSEPLLAHNVWPTEVDVKTSAQRYLNCMVDLSARLDEVVADLIEFPDLAALSGAGPDTMASIRYEHRADEDAPDPEQTRMGAHSDYTSFTILCADPVPGLEVVDPDGSWTPVTPEPDALLVNVGDLLAMATGDRWRSTLHRVPIPTGPAAVPVRRSVAYFHYPNLDVEIVPPENSAYRAMTVNEHLASRLAGPKTHTTSDTNATLAGRKV